MRSVNSAIERYIPSAPPADPNAPLGPYLQQEFARISAMLDLLAQGQAEVLHAAPAKPREGMTRVADGTDWNPGSGQGVYTYYAAAWHKLG